MIRAYIMKTEFTDDGPVESLFRVFEGAEENLRREVESLNAAKFRKPKRPDLVTGGELFHPPTKFEAISSLPQ